MRPGDAEAVGQAGSVATVQSSTARPPRTVSGGEGGGREYLQPDGARLGGDRAAVDARVGRGHAGQGQLGTGHHGVGQPRQDGGPRNDGGGGTPPPRSF